MLHVHAHQLCCVHLVLSYFSDEESTLSGSINHSSFMFVTMEQLLKYIEHLDKRNNVQVSTFGPLYVKLDICAASCCLHDMYKIIEATWVVIEGR